MSGGQWDYNQFLVRDLTNDVADDDQIAEEFPVLAAKIRALGSELSGICHKLDYHVCGDTLIHDPAAFTEEAVLRLFRALVLGKEDRTGRKTE